MYLVKRLRNVVSGGPVYAQPHCVPVSEFRRRCFNPVYSSLYIPTAIIASTFFSREGLGRETSSLNVDERLCRQWNYILIWFSLLLVIVCECVCVCSRFRFSLRFFTAVAVPIMFIQGFTYQQRLLPQPSSRGRVSGERRRR